MSFAPLVNGNAKIVRYDLRDAGASTTVNPEAPAYTLRDLAADAAALARGFDDRPAHLAGIGVGGFVAQVAALDYPDAFSALTLVGTRPVGPGPVDDDLPDHDPALINARSSFPTPDWSDRAAVADFAAARAEILRDDPAAARATAERIFDRTPGTKPPVQMANQLGMVFSKLDCKPRWRERMPELAIPALVVHGRRDRFFPVGNGEALAREIPGARSPTRPPIRSPRRCSRCRRSLSRYPRAEAGRTAKGPIVPQRDPLMAHLLPFRREVLTIGAAALLRAVSGTRVRVAARRHLRRSEHSTARQRRLGHPWPVRRHPCRRATPLAAGSPPQPGLKGTDTAHKPRSGGEKARPEDLQGVRKRGSGRARVSLPVPAGRGARGEPRDPSPGPKPPWSGSGPRATRPPPGRGRDPARSRSRSAARSERDRPCSFEESREGVSTSPALVRHVPISRFERRHEHRAAAASVSIEPSSILIRASSSARAWARRCEILHRPARADIDIRRQPRSTAGLAGERAQRAPPGGGPGSRSPGPHQAPALAARSRLVVLAGVPSGSARQQTGPAPRESPGGRRCRPGPCGSRHPPTVGHWQRPTRSTPQATQTGS